MAASLEWSRSEPYASRWRHACTPKCGPSTHGLADPKLSRMLDRLDERLGVAAPPLSYFGLKLGTRMTIVRLAGGELWVHSPIALTPELRAAVEALGPVRYVVAPSLFHHLFAAEWLAPSFPGAVLHGPRQPPRKRQDPPLTAPPEGAPPAPGAAELLPVH